MAHTTLTRFMGGSPGQVALRLVFLSFVVGVVLSAIDLNPMELVDMAVSFVQRLWNMGFEALGNIGRYFLLGAVIVIPLWLVSRLFAFGRGE